jgi:hypothetical protein
MIAASFFTSAAGLLFATQAALALPSLNPSAVDLTNAKIPLPADPTPLVAPTGVPSYVGKLYMFLLHTFEFLRHLPLLLNI